MKERFDWLEQAGHSQRTGECESIPASAAEGQGN